MIPPRLVSLGVCFLVLGFHGSLAQLPGGHERQQSSRRSECQIVQITAREPNRRQVSEAGFSEFWDSGENDELECAGVQVVRHTINPKGLLLPYYPSTPELVYVLRGEGLQGTVLPGCPETFETSFPSEKGQQQFTDKHQRVYRYKEGDILALPAGAVHWTYNDGHTPIVVVVLRDTSNLANQLDRNFRKFLLAGNLKSLSEGGYNQQQPASWAGREQPEWRGRPGEREQPSSRTGPHEWDTHDEAGSNIYSGFDDDILQQVFDVEYEIVSQLKGLNDDRGLIVLAENFKVLVPEEEAESFNIIEETICSIKLSANIASPVHADVYNPRGGRISSLNSYKLPVLESFQLNAEKGVLYSNALVAPHYNPNAHSIIYITSGSSRIQIVGNDGSSVFDGEVQEGQLIVIPQDFAMIKKAGEQGCEWVAFKTNDNAITTQLAGRFSFIGALPQDVLVNSYNISPEAARNLKNSRQEGVVLSPRSRSPLKQAQNALLNALIG